MRRRSVFATLAVVAALAAPTVAFGGLAHAGDQRPPTPVAPMRRDRPVRPPIVTSVQTRERVVALSFDDGPDPRWTPTVLDALAAAGARATFFVTGEHARAHPELLRALASAGHEVANHTETHPNLDQLPAAAVTLEVQQATEAISAMGVVPHPFFRPPRGRYNAETLAGVEPTGLQTIGWTVCFERWLRNAGPVIGVEAAIARVRPGGIIVAHDGGIPNRGPTVAALPALLTRLRDEGYRVVPIGELLRLGPTVHGLPGDGRSDDLQNPVSRRARWVLARAGTDSRRGTGRTHRRAAPHQRERGPTRPAGEPAP